MEVWMAQQWAFILTVAAGAFALLDVKLQQLAKAEWEAWVSSLRQ